MVSRRPNLVRALQKIDPDIESHFQTWDSPDHQNRVTVPGQCVSWLYDATEGFHQSDEGVPGIIGRHGKQKALFHLANAGLCGAAKSCGHGNHEGSRQGAIHWERVRKPISLKRFYQEFGIDHSDSLMPDVSVWRGRLAIAREQLRSKISGD